MVVDLTFSFVQIYSDRKEKFDTATDDGREAGVDNISTQWKIGMQQRLMGVIIKKGYFRVRLTITGGGIP